MSDKVHDACEKYRKNRGLYEALTEKTKLIVKDILELEDINYSNITGRTKNVLSYERKARDPKYSDPEKEIFDMSGIRIILFTLKDTQKTWEVIQKSFKLIPEQTVDKSSELGVDRMGYRSIHCVGLFDDSRAGLPEYLLFKDMCFEIQVRTILQHAWAEFEHDRNYKFRGVLPDEIKRRLSILAGMLELTDNEFEKISEDIDMYAKEVSTKTEKGDLDIQITSISLVDYLNTKFKKLIELGLVTPELMTSDDKINQLNTLGIKTLEQFDNIVPEDYIERIIPVLESMRASPETSSFIYYFDGIIYDVMLIAFKKEFLEISGYTTEDLSSYEIKFYKSYGFE